MDLQHSCMSFWQPKCKIYLASFKIQIQIWPGLSEEFNTGFKIEIRSCVGKQWKTLFYITSPTNEPNLSFL